MSTWFRVHNDILDNPKLILLSPADRWYYTGILSLKSQGVLDQFAGEKLDRVMAAKLRLTPAEWSETRRRLQEENLIDEHCQPVGWDERQFKSDSSAERVRRHREKKKTEKRPGNANVTLHGNVGETLQQRRSSGEVTPPEYRVQSTENLTSDTYVSGADAPGSQPAPTLDQLSVIYNDPDVETRIFKHGTRMLRRAGVDYQEARKILQKHINAVGPGRVLDALIICLVDQPDHPVPYLQAVISKQGAPIPRDWVPSAPCLSELASLGVPEDIPAKARDIFVIWFSSQGICHNNWPALFVRWCQLDWERAEGNRTAYLQRLAASAGLEYQEAWKEPA